MHVRVRRQNQIVTCDSDANCDEDPLVAQLSTPCLGCLIAQDGQQSSGPPPIEACLSGGGAPSGGDGDGPPACVLDQIAPFREANDMTGMVQYVCSEQFDTSTCDAAEMANINSARPEMCPPPPPPPPVEVEVTIVEYTEEETTVAAAEVAAAFALAQPPPAPAGTPPPPPAPVVKIAATVGFPVDIATIAEGSAARQTFEAEFQTSMAGSIGGGSAVSADDIVIDDIAAGRRRLSATDSRRRAQSSAVSVQFHVVAPAAVSTQAASLIAAVDTSSLAVGNVVATSMTPPVVTAPPDVDCVGAWGTCSASCADKIYQITTVASGSGTACSAEHYDTMACAPGDGACPTAAPSTIPAPAPAPAPSTSSGSLTAVVYTAAALVAATMML